MESALERHTEGRVSGHSLQVGGAQSLAAAGASVVEMQTVGRWQSPSMPAHYVRGQLAARGAQSPGSATGRRNPGGDPGTHASCPLELRLEKCLSERAS